MTNLIAKAPWPSSRYSGRMQPTACRTVAANYVRGSALVATDARMRIRWLLFETDVDIPLSLAVSVAAPDGRG